MIGSEKARWTLGAVILISFCVQWASPRARTVYIKPGNQLRSYSRIEDDSNEARGGSGQNAIADPNHKHLRHLKAPDPAVVEKVRKRLRARMKGRKLDQSNERNIWTSHPKNENWSGPDSEDVYEIRASLGI